MLFKYYSLALAGASILIPVTVVGPGHISEAIAQNTTISELAQAPSIQVTVQELKGFKGAITALAVSPDGSRLVVATGDGTISMIDLDNLDSAYTRTFDVNDFSNISYSPDGKVFAAAQERAIGVFGVRGGRKKETLSGHSGKVSALAISPDAKTLVSVSGEDQTIRVWDLEEGRLIETIGEEVGSVTEVAFAPSGQYFVTGSIANSRYLKFWDANTFELLQTYPQQPNIFGLAITPDGQTLLAAVKNFIRAWDINTSQQLWSVKAASLDINTIAVSPDGRLLATADKSRRVGLFDVATGKQLTSLEGHRGWVLTVAFSPDGRFLFSGAEDKVVKIWQLFP